MSITAQVQPQANTADTLKSESGGSRPIANADELAKAFELFTSVSAQLTDSYQEMELQVGQLNAELHDLAEQRLHELKEKERVSSRLENLLNLLPAGVVVLDKRGVVSQCNPAAIDLLGEPLEGELWRDIIQRCFAPQLDDGHEISLQDGRRINMVTRSLEREPGQLILLTDMTETRELQRRLDRHRRLSEMGRMMSSLAHQIRTPLSAAMLYAGHLADSELSTQQIQRFAQKVVSRLNHLDQQVKDMLIFVKGDVKLTDTITMSQLMMELNSAADVPFRNTDSSFTVINEVPELCLQTNCESMVGALMNLVNNAMQSQPGPVDIVVTCRDGGEGCVQILVCDNGPGIDGEVLRHLHEPFFTTKPQGTGLGLSVVRAVVLAHQGEFELRSQPGRGTCAVIQLPTVQSSVQAR